MPFDDPKDFKPNRGLKEMAGSKSMFDGKPRPPSKQEFEQRVQDTQEKASGYKKRAADLFVQFNRAMADKTLPQNRNVFNNESEKEMLQNILQLGEDVNIDPNEKEGMGSLTILTLLLKTCMVQRDRINELEYAMGLLSKRLDMTAVSDYINKEIKKALDKKKDGE